MPITVRELTTRLADLLRREHECMAEFLVALAEFHESRGWEELGHSSLFHFLHRDLGLSKSAAFYRMTAAELAGRFPDVLDGLRSGRLCLSTVGEVAKVVTRENHAEVLPRFFGLSKREAQELVAALKPAVAPALRDVVTVSSSGGLRFPEPSATGEPASARDLPPTSGSPANLLDANSSSVHGGLLPQPNAARAVIASPAPGSERDLIEPMTADLRRLHVTVDRECLDLIEKAKDALSHAVPEATSNDVLKAALRAFLAEQDRKKKAAVSKPRAEARPSTTDRAPANVKRAVWERDDGKCQWPLDCGGICGFTRRLELAHRDPRARGGPATVENLRLLCRFHNQYEARLQFGEAFMERFSGRRLERAAHGGDASAPPTLALVP